MLTSSPSPQFNAANSRHAGSHKSPYSFRAPSKNNTASSSPRGNSRSSAAIAKSASASPTASKPSGPPLGYRSPKRPTSDAGTQYTPPGLPPTARDNNSSVSSLNESIPSDSEQAQVTIADRKSPSAAIAAQNAPAEPPPAPQVRETPQSTLAATSAEISRPVSPSVPSSTKQGVKRRRQSGVEVKLLPAQYHQCDPKVLAALIAGLLMDLIHHNDNIKLEEVQLTRFHSRTPPGISVHDYMQRLTHHATLPSPVLLAMVNYIDKLCEAFPIFTINSLTVHRFLIAAATVAAKGLCDVFWTNSLYAKVGGVSKKELALLELELLMKAEWRIVPETAKLEEYYKSLVDGSDEFALEDSELIEESEASTSASQSSDSIGTDTMDTD